MHYSIRTVYVIFVAFSLSLCRGCARMCCITKQIPYLTSSRHDVTCVAFFFAFYQPVVVIVAAFFFPLHISHIHDLVLFFLSCAINIKRRSDLYSILSFFFISTERRMPNVRMHCERTQKRNGMRTVSPLLLFCCCSCLLFAHYSNACALFRGWLLCVLMKCKRKMLVLCSRCVCVCVRVCLRSCVLHVLWLRVFERVCVRVCVCHVSAAYLHGNVVSIGPSILSFRSYFDCIGNGRKQRKIIHIQKRSLIYNSFNPFPFTIFISLIFHNFDLIINRHAVVVN